MKHFLGGLETQPLLRLKIQSVLNHSQLFLRHCTQRPLFGYVLAQQAIEVFITAPLPAAVGVGKVRLQAQGLVNLLMLREFFSNHGIVLPLAQCVCGY